MVNERQDQPEGRGGVVRVQTDGSPQMATALSGRVASLLFVLTAEVQILLLRLPLRRGHRFIQNEHPIASRRGDIVEEYEGASFERMRSGGQRYVYRTQSNFLLGKLMDVLQNSQTVLLGARLLLRGPAAANTKHFRIASILSEFHLICNTTRLQLFSA